MARATLRVSNLPPHLTEDHQIIQLFSQTEQFLSARLVRESPGVALIDYSSLLSAQAVKERYNGWAPFVGSSPIVVELQPAAAMKAPGGLAYGGYGGCNPCICHQVPPFATHSCSWLLPSSLPAADPDSYGKMVNGASTKQGSSCSNFPFACISCMALPTAAAVPGGLPQQTQGTVAQSNSSSLARAPGQGGGAGSGGVVQPAAQAGQQPTAVATSGLAAALAGLSQNQLSSLAGLLGQGEMPTLCCSVCFLLVSMYSPLHLSMSIMPRVPCNLQLSRLSSKAHSSKLSSHSLSSNNQHSSTRRCRLPCLLNQQQSLPSLWQ
jgi:hypothetical protein